MIPQWSFRWCTTIERVIVADTGRRIEDHAFYCCFNLSYVRLSTNLEYIGHGAFNGCSSLASVNTPSSCREIGDYAFGSCTKLIILKVPQHARLGRNAIARTPLFEASTFETNEDGVYSDTSTEVNTWVKSINDGEGLALHRICSSDNPDTEQAYRYLNDHSLQCHETSK